MSRISKKGKRCKRCGKQFELGYTGIDTGLCDKCAKISRTKNGGVAIGGWYPWEKPS
jgi:hypothetical protein